MHELSQVMAIVEKAEATVLEHGARDVDSITLRIGRLAGVEPDALALAWEAAIPQTVLEHASKMEKTSEAVFICRNCQKEFTADDLFACCPLCGSSATELVAGDEFIIEQIILNL